MQTKDKLRFLEDIRNSLRDDIELLYDEYDDKSFNRTLIRDEFTADIEHIRKQIAIVEKEIEIIEKVIGND